MQVTDREILQELADRPIGGAGIPACSGPNFAPEAIEAARRASGIWLPMGKRSAATPELKARKKELREAQIDIEDAIEAAGGHRGTAGAH